MIVAQFGNNHENFKHSYFVIDATDEASAAEMMLKEIKKHDTANKFRIGKTLDGYVIRTIDPAFGWEYGIIFIPYQNKLTSNEEIEKIINLMTTSNSDNP